MAKAAEAALNLDLTAFWVVGDRPEDIGLAEASRGIGGLRGNGQLPAAWCVVVPEPGRRGPLHHGAYRPMNSVYDPPGPTRLADGSPVKFPVAPHANAGSYFDAYADEISRAAKTIEPEALDRAGALLIEAYARGSRVFSCGNGGSASIANHMQCDHVKGVRTATDLAPRVQSLSTNVELLTAIANDMGYENVFVYQLQSQAEPGDVLVAVSSSGRSPNIVQALTWARDHGLRTIAITGFDGGAAKAGRRGQHPCRLHELRRHRGPASGHHARSGPVRPSVANERGRDLDDRVLNHGSRRKPGRDAKSGALPISQDGVGRHECAWRSTS